MMSENDLRDIYRTRNPVTKRFICHRKTSFKGPMINYDLGGRTSQSEVSGP